MSQPSSGERTEAPTPRRLRQARQRGDVFQSRDLTALAVMLSVVAAWLVLWPGTLKTLLAYLKRSFSSAASAELTGALPLGLDTLVVIALPVLLAALAGAMVGSYVQVGPLFSAQAVKPNLAKLNPMANVKQVFGKHAWLQLAKTCAKFLIIGWIAAKTVVDQLPSLLALARFEPAQSVAVVGQLAWLLTSRIAVAAVVFALVDYGLERLRYHRKQRMTKDEVKREFKEAEGDPQHKAERQRVHREVVEHQMIERVASADCVIINPTKLAIALRYDAEQMDAPQVVATGRNLTAARIRQIARRHGVPIFRDVSLARALITLEEDQNIPADLYEAVAQILRVVYEQPEGSHPGR